MEIIYLSCSFLYIITHINRGKQQQTICFPFPKNNREFIKLRVCKKTPKMKHSAVSPAGPSWFSKPGTQYGLLLVIVEKNAAAFGVQLQLDIALRKVQHKNREAENLRI
ncbi:uncharacterized protein ASCRUDRAFT_110343 [Ascoidea rubescens DSM 1968]|uniref:Uncharacterized protein n=1 Tax=Ascoidea rubescens DSM 1968 TaxID=1344418 RepID=A0A1D2VD70_9ASCO|nr:hypothetical protein ASCRUDRAFT_110343 [Ascoidea rubescens DSM 1968]ODV59644.1 hypothetical protein ASCRUDRAFT_110343 [Ascoidea rubescens DSM 1968]